MTVQAADPLLYGKLSHNHGKHLPSTLNAVFHTLLVGPLQGHCIVCPISERRNREAQAVQGLAQGLPATAVRKQEVHQ